MKPIDRNRKAWLERAKKWIAANTPIRSFTSGPEEDLAREFEDVAKQAVAQSRLRKSPQASLLVVETQDELFELRFALRERLVAHARHLAYWSTTEHARAPWVATLRKSYRRARDLESRVREALGGPSEGDLRFLEEWRANLQALAWDDTVFQPKRREHDD